MAGILINSAINLVARTAYFNNYNNGIIQREMSFRDVPKSQQVDEIIEYCKTHENPNISDILGCGYHFNPPLEIRSNSLNSEIYCFT